MSEDKNKEDNPEQSRIKQDTEKVPDENITSVEPTEPGAEITDPISESNAKSAESEKENMEVHHHPHIHHNKKWTEYLLGFLCCSWQYFLASLRKT